MQSNSMDDKEIKRIGNLRDQSFEEAYQVHDVGEALVSDRIEEYNFQVFNHGDDKRDEDVYSGTGVDLGVRHQSQTVGWIEVKTKKSTDWLGRLNKSDWEEYRGFATYQDQDVYIYFCHVTDVDSAEVGERYFIRVPTMHEDEIASTLPFTSKGHKIVEIPDAHRLQWPDIIGSFVDEL